jgi:glucuronoarabinoxylan endo-1,4-beta-xylanase
VSTPAQAAMNGNYWTTSEASRHRQMKAIKIVWPFIAGVSLLLLVALLTRTFWNRDIVINWNSTGQTIDGFGASATGYAGTITSAQADEFFSAEKGLGLSLLRLTIIPDTIDFDCFCIANSNPFRCVKGSHSQILSGDLQVAHLAVERGAKLFAMPGSPPAEMKTSGKFCGRGAMIGTPANYSAYASDLASFPALLADNKLSIDAMSIQNEPDIENEYDTCSWTGQQIHDFIPYLSSALHFSGFPGVKIAAPEESNWTFEKLNAALDDGKVAADIGLILGHAYGAESPSGVPARNGLHVWQSEVSDFGDYDGSMRNALRWARSINNYMGAGANAWMYWNLDCGTTQFNSKSNMCLTDQNQNLAKRAYVLGQYAKFIRPGWQRIDVANHGRLLVSAYKGPSRSFAIVVVNEGRLPIIRQTFQLNGVTSQNSQVTPWLTSSSASLAAQPRIAFSSVGTAITYTIPAKSVVTFVGQAD